MIAYNKTDLRNLYIHQQLTEAAARKFLSRAEAAQVKAAHPIKFYTPNKFVKTGLGLLTFFIALCIFGLTSLVFHTGGSFTAILIVLGMTAYLLLEFITVSKLHYNSGVDNTLMVLCAVFITAAIVSGAASAHSGTLMSLTLLLVSAWLAIRFADSFAAIVATISVLSLVFNICSQLVAGTNSTLPYLLVVVAGVIYFVSNKLAANKADFIYHHLWFSVSAIALLAFYLCGNFYVVDEIIKNSYRLQVATPSAVSPFFWLWTLCIPLLYFLLGILQRNWLLTKAGVLLSGVAVITFRYYYHVITAEAALVIAGGALLVSTWALMRFLSTPKHGFVFDKDDSDETENNNFESLIPGVIQGGQHAPVQGPTFGGGNFGGAGSGSNY